MESKTLLSGIVGFIAGGFLVSVLAVMTMGPSSHMTIEGKSGDEFDQAFISTMIEHHEGAVEMAKQAQQHAKHNELKSLSSAIITAQQKEIDQLKLWQKQWGYSSTSDADDDMSHMNH